MLLKQIRSKKSLSVLSKRQIKAGAVFLGGAVLVLFTIYHYCGEHFVDGAGASRAFEIVYRFSFNGVSDTAEEVRIWVPLPPSNNQQDIEAVNVEGGRQYEIVEDAEYGNRFLVFDIDSAEAGGGSKIERTIRFHVLRRAVRAGDGVTASEKVSESMLRRFLAADRLVPVGGKIAKEARGVAGHLESPVQRARALYDHIVDSLEYDKSGTGWGKGDAIYMCDVRKGNCTDFHSLFIGEVRSLGIPARFVMGLPVPEEKGEGVIEGYHCWAEFYIEGRGWFPIDASEASKHPRKREMCFGRLDANRVAFTVGRDITLPGAQAGPLNYLIYPHVEVDGWVHGDVETKFFFRDF